VSNRTIRRSAGFGTNGGYSGHFLLVRVRNKLKRRQARSGRFVSMAPASDNTGSLFYNDN
jgi:hypothetical protein